MKFVLTAAICLLIFIHDIQTANVVGGNVHSKTIEYLKSFGYLPQSKNNKEITHKELKHALKKLQVSIANKEEMRKEKFAKILC